MSTTMEDMVHEEMNENWAWNQVLCHALIEDGKNREHRAFQLGFRFALAFAKDQQAEAERASSKPEA